MKTLIFTVLTFFCLSSYGQGNYEKAMGEALQLWGSGKTKEASAQFERIAQAEQDKWLPKYYQTLTLITNSFGIQDEAEKTNALKKINELIPQDNLNSEWLVLRALASTSDLTSDPMNKAMILSPAIIADYEAAIKMDPKNPRALIGLAEFNIQSKKYMGGDTKEECESLQKALTLFSDEKPAELFYPTWGKERAEALLKECK
ncbi:hypothetical protein [Sphingobacterium daejeonense]|uniref:hypothetical protein n=1 Tax=Sphingobacterium daejeonense TaxID=371142 RepID=UPI003D3146A9